MIWIKKQKINPEVTDYYLETIGNSYIKMGQRVAYFKDWKECKAKKDDVVVVTRYKEVLRMIATRKKYVYWVQGILPEENFALYHSKIKYALYDLIEKVIFTHTNKKKYLLVMVSERMKIHYENKYNCKVNSYYIMPCNNDSIHEFSFFEKDKYSENVFCYAGGLNVWQCIEETLCLYKQIEERDNSSKLLMLVKNHDLAKELVKKYNIKNVEYDFVPVDKLPEKLKSVKYGFIVREDVELNRVATPTKLMTYMGNGVIPILSDCLEGLTENLVDTKYLIKLKNTQDVESILQGMKIDVDNQEIFNDYSRIYSEIRYLYPYRTLV